MIARHYGRILPIDELREKCGITRSGVTLGGIADAAENFNLKTVAIRASMRTLEHEVPLPCIAHWQQKHFVVVHALNTKHVHVADPAFGLIKYSKREFMKSPEAIGLATQFRFFSIRGDADTMAPVERV
ncbi:MAG: cysteine peptidase family C39 domain-containing protein [Methylococcaceae bacterium]|nr:cysteine peptidase family C39 domain-containing protein [Methylococcaceae bacterium]MCI0668364.1 cysteine peptidase family C39 domain-containing protein [Methylococcaceae bacterium]